MAMYAKNAAVKALVVMAASLLLAASEDGRYYRSPRAYYEELSLSLEKSSSS